MRAFASSPVGPGGGVGRRHGARLAFLVAAIALVVEPVAAAAGGGEQSPGEYEVKAALLFNFAKFVDWPASTFATPDAPFVIGVVGNDPFGPTLERVLDGKTVAGRPIVIRRWRKARDQGECQILFVAASEQSGLGRILAGVESRPVLTVADMSGFAPQGGIVGLVVQDSRIRFEINAGRAEAAHLRMSSRLLSLARIVSDSR